MRKHFIALALTLCSIFTSGYAFAADSAAFDPTYIPISAQSSGSSVPVGTVVAWPAALANQSQCVAAVSQEDAQAKGCEWLICDGSSIDSAAYPALTAIVGTSLPNYKGMFLRGYGSQAHSQNNGSSIGTTSTTHASGNLGAVQGDALRNISGTFEVRDNYYSIGAFTNATGVFSANGGGGGGRIYRTSGYVAQKTLNFTLSNAVATATENRPVNVAVNYIIKAY